MAQPVDDKNFDEEVLKSEIPVLVDFWAEWCGPCRMLSPIIDQLSSEFEGKVKILKMNVDENPNIPSSLGIRGIPTVYLFKNGKEIGSKVGLLTKDNYSSWIKENI